MKKVLPLLLIFLLLSSCSSLRQRELSEDESEAGRQMLLQGERNAIIETESEVFVNIDDLVLPSSYALYSADLPQFRRLQDDYTEALRQSLEASLGSVVDYLLEELNSLDLTDVASYLDAGYSSVSAELEEKYFDSVHSLFLESLEGSEEERNQSYTLLEREANIWRENQLNLGLVGQFRSLPQVRPVDSSHLADYATERFCATLAENEVGQRRLLIDSL